MIRDPRASLMVATVDGADVAALQARPGRGGAIIIGQGNASNNTAYAGYLSGWINAQGTQGGGAPLPGRPQLPAGQGPVSTYNSALETLRRAGAATGGLRT